jgi:hypothetical protein
MRTIKILIPALALAGFVGASLAAQQPATGSSSPTPQSSSAQSNAPSAPAPSTAGVPEASNEQLRPVTGELEKKIDTKNAKAGDPVILKTTENATTADGIVIPKGSRIVGHVTDVQAHSKTNPNARLTIQFDQAEIKGRQTLPIRTVLESVAPAPTTVHPTDTLNSPGMGGTPMASASASGAPGATSGSPAGAAPGSAQTATSAGGGAPTMSAGTEQQATTAAPKRGEVVARQGNVAIKTTAVPGALLATNANGQPFSNAAGALLGAKQNVHLDGGTEIVLAVMDTPQKPGTR